MGLSYQYKLKRFKRLAFISNVLRDLFLEFHLTFVIIAVTKLSIFSNDKKGQAYRHADMQAGRQAG